MSMIRPLSALFGLFCLLFSLNLAMADSASDCRRAREILKNAESTSADRRSAITMLDRTIANDPNCAEAYLVRGQIYARIALVAILSKERGQAVKDFNKAIELDPKLGEAYWERASDRRMAMNMLKFGDPNLKSMKEVLDDLDHAISNGYDTAAAYESRGQWRLQLLEAVEEARRKEENPEIDLDRKEVTKLNKADFEKALELDANRAASHFQLGQILADEGEHELAIEHLEKALKLDHRADPTLQLLAEEYERTGKYERQVEVLSDLINLRKARKYDKKEYSRELHDLGVAYLHLYDFDKASESFQSAAETLEATIKELKDPSDLFANDKSMPESTKKALVDASRRDAAKKLPSLEARLAHAHAYNGYALGRLKKVEQSKAEFEKGLLVDTVRPEVYLLHGDIYYAAGDGNSAKADYENALKLNGSAFADRYRSRLEMIQAVELMQANDLAKAADVIDDAIRHDPNFAGGYEIATTIHLRARQFDKGVEICNEWIKHFPRDADAFGKRGFFESRLNKINDAIADLDTATRYNPNDAKTFFLLADLLSSQKQYMVAIDRIESGMKASEKVAPGRQLNYALLSAAMDQPEGKWKEILDKAVKSARESDLKAGIHLVDTLLEDNLNPEKLNEIKTRLTVQLQSMTGAQKQ